MSQTLQAQATDVNIDQMLEKARDAAKELKNFSQERVDKIVEQLALAIYNNAEPISKLAVEETRMGNLEHKILKKKSKSENIWQHLKDVKTVGIINQEEGLIEIAEPVGIVGSITPVTNPGVTPMSNAMFALKGRNPIIVAPHPSAKKCSKLAVDLMIEYASKVGLPANAIQIIEEPSKEATIELMAKVDYIVATGGGAMVKSAYSSGKPAYGVGPGNVPVLIDKTVDIQSAVQDIITGKVFDYGLICSSEQTVVTTSDIADSVKEEFVKQGAYMLSEEEKANLEAIMYPEGRKMPGKEVIGQSPEQIASLIGVTLPANQNKLLLVPINEIGPNEPFSGEKMSPILALYVTNNNEESIQACVDLLTYQGAGHTAAIHSNDQELIMKFSQTVIASRVVVNQPSSTSAGGSKFNKLDPTTTLSCGSWGNNAYSGNITAKHFINTKRVAFKLNQPKFDQSDLSKLAKLAKG